MEKRDSEEFWAYVKSSVEPVYRQKGWDYNAALHGVWMGAFPEYPVAQVCQAMADWVLEQEWPPVPAEIRRRLVRSGGTSSLAAWEKARRAVRKVGAYRSVRFADPRVHAVIEAMGGWPAFCALNDEERPFRQKEFERLYEMEAGRQQTSYPDHLAGLTEEQNRLRGFDALPPESAAGRLMAGQLRPVEVDAPPERRALAAPEAAPVPRATEEELARAQAYVAGLLAGHGSRGGGFAAAVNDEESEETR